MIVNIDIDKLQLHLNKCGVKLFIVETINKTYRGDGPLTEANSTNHFEVSCNIQGRVADESFYLTQNPISYDPVNAYPPDDIRNKAYEMLLIDLIMYGATYLRRQKKRLTPEDRQ